MQGTDRYVTTLYLSVTATYRTPTRSHIDRLSQLVAASFGVQKLHAHRAKIAYQAKVAGLTVDAAKFVWWMSIEDMSHLVGHANTRVTELVYRKELRPVL